MVWVRRIGFLVVLVAVIGGYFMVKSRQEASAAARRAHLARVTAKIWIAAAEYRSQPDSFLIWRDSFLAAENLSVDSLQQYLMGNEQRPEEADTYARLVSFYVDSLIRERTDMPDSASFDVPYEE